MEPEPIFLIGASKLIADLLGLKASELQEIYEYKNSYTTKKIAKRNGKLRTINEPHAVLKKFQSLFLSRWLYRIYFRGFLDHRIYSFLPERSAVKNVRAHTKGNARYIIKLDLKDAFPSITSLLLSKSLEWAINREILFLKKDLPELKKWYGRGHERKFAYPRNPLFPHKRVAWFRKLIKNEKANERVDDIISQFVFRLVPLLTYRDYLPQGAPTSPFLLNLVISYLALIDKISAYLKSQGYSSLVTAYCDDFTISTSRAPTDELIAGIEMEIEKTGLKINRAKTKIFDRRQIAPLIMGLRLTKTTLSGEAIKPLFTKLPVTRGARKRYNKGGKWQLNEVALPKKYLRQTRAMMHNLALCPKNEKLIATVKGRLSYIISIYGRRNLPAQLRVPYLEITQAGIAMFKYQLFS